MYKAFLFYDFVFSKQVQTSLALFNRTRSLLKTRFLDFGVNCFFSSSEFFPSVERCMRIYIHLILMRSYYRTSYTHICVTYNSKNRKTSEKSPTGTNPPAKRGDGLQRGRLRPGA